MEGKLPADGRRESECSRKTGDEAHFQVIKSVQKTPTPSVRHSVMSDFLQPHELQPTRLFCPGDSPGKNTGVGCHALLQSLIEAEKSTIICLGGTLIGILLAASDRNLIPTSLSRKDNLRGVRLRDLEASLTASAFFLTSLCQILPPPGIGSAYPRVGPILSSDNLVSSMYPGMVVKWWLVWFQMVNGLWHHHL